MTSQPGRLEILLRQINDGQAAQALPELELLHTRNPGNLAVLTLRAEALRHSGRHQDAIEAYRKAGESGAGARNWLVAGIMLASERATEQSVHCLQQALREAPGNEEILDALITTLFNNGRHKDGIGYARQQLSSSRNPTLLSRAALLLQSNDLYEESTDAFRRIIDLAPDDLSFVGAALVPARFTCDWDWIELLQRKIKDCYQLDDFASPQEFPLTNLTWCADEAVNAGVTRAYVSRMVARPTPLAPAPQPPQGRRIRVGYLSSDFRNHATMHLLAGVLEHHDRGRFEVFAYDHTNPDISEYRQRFLDAVEHHVPVNEMSDEQAARRIAADRLDILFDLKLYTGNGRSGIPAYRPAALQATYLGFPGSAASPDIDYVVSDRFVTPDGSKPFYSEKLCRLPHSYQCNDRRRAAAADPGTRARHGLPEGRTIFGAFNQSYKIDRGSFAVWMRILQEVPGSVLWLLGQSEAARANLSRHARLAGIGPDRIIYAPFATPQDHLARLKLADAVLDTLVCNGHTTTSDALWAGVPVITARGRHFASRVSESLLNAMDLPELVGDDADGMVRIARRIGTDTPYRDALRARIAANRLSAPLFDTARFTRDFETAIGLMVDRHRSGQAPDHMDVPDAGPMDTQPPQREFTGRVAALQTAYRGCPLCGGDGQSLGFAQTATHPLWHEPLPATIEWLQCGTCSHVHTRHHWSDGGRAELAKAAPANPAPGTWPARHASRIKLVESVTRQLGGYDAVMGRESRPAWVDVGCGDGSLLAAALDYGYAAVGLDTSPAPVEDARQLGFSALVRDFMTVDFEIVPDVLTLLDVLPQLPDPRAALRKAALLLKPGGVLVVSAPDRTSSGWRHLEATQTNPYWPDITRHHAFSKAQLVALLKEYGFDVRDMAVPPEHPGHVELLAVRRQLDAVETLRLADAICLERRGGLGDVLMALGAAKALKQLSGRPVCIVTAPRFHDLVRSCPHVDRVETSRESIASAYAVVRHVNLNPIGFSISRKHQADAYLDAFGITADAGLKHIDLNPDPAAEAEVDALVASWPAVPAGRSRILLHAAQGDPNRTWPLPQWDALATILLQDGHQVIAIGSTADSAKAALGITAEGTLNAVDALSMKATIALMRRSDLFVSTDSGPVQLAAATDIGIVGLYSSVHGPWRLPFRHETAAWRAVAVGPSCRFQPCYQQMYDDSIMAPHLARVHSGETNINEVFANWCPDGGSFACMKQQITVPMVLDAIRPLLAR